MIVRVEATNVVCDNGHTYRSFLLAGNGYGSMLYWSDSGTTAYVNAISDSAFNELIALVKVLRLEDGMQTQRGKFVQHLFGMTADPDAHGGHFAPEFKSRCSVCGSDAFEGWVGVDEYFDLDVPAIKHDQWNLLSESEKWHFCLICGAHSAGSRRSGHSGRDGTLHPTRRAGPTS